MSSKKSLDALGQRQKTYEGIETIQTFIPGLPICVRLDGRCFSSFTRGLARPYDERLTKLMVQTTKYLVKKYNATIGYTQSDEISLVLKNDYNSPAIFNGEKMKLVSHIAASASGYLNALLGQYLPEKAHNLEDEDNLDIPTMDCRAWNVPNVDEAANNILWREQDATKNSILMAGSTVFSNKQLFKKNTREIKAMLFDKGIVWEDYPTSFKFGTYVQRDVYYNDEGIVRSRIIPIDWFSSLKEYEHAERIQIVMEAYPPEQTSEEK